MGDTVKIKALRSFYGDGTHYEANQCYTVKKATADAWDKRGRVMVINEKTAVKGGKK